MRGAISGDRLPRVVSIESSLQNSGVGRAPINGLSHVQGQGSCKEPSLKTALSRARLSGNNDPDSFVGEGLDTTPAGAVQLPPRIVLAGKDTTTTKSKAGRRGDHKVSRQVSCVVLPLRGAALLSVAPEATEIRQQWSATIGVEGRRRGSARPRQNPSSSLEQGERAGRMARVQATHHQQFNFGGNDAA
jgi:hypothetical protein